MSAGRFISRLVRIGTRRPQRTTARQSTAWQRYRKLFLSAALPLCLVAPAWADPTPATTLTVTKSTDGEEEGTLRWAINEANASSDAVIIAFDAGVTRVELADDLPIITKGGEALKISGNGSDQLTIDGNDAHQVFRVQTGTVTIEDLTIADGRVQGGAGGHGISGGGGGLGAGGALFVDENAAVIVQDVVLSGNQARGGAGGNATYDSLGGGGGGGLNGGDGADGVEDEQIGGAGGGPNGGVGGTYNTNGGAGGAYSGGGGGAITNGTASTAGGNGGFGGGGGAGTNRSGGTAGTGGFGGGDGGQDNKGGSGGDGLGGAIFIRSGGSLTIIDGSLSDNSTIAGARGVRSTDPRNSTYFGESGTASGGGIYLNDSSLTYQVSTGETVTITDSIGGTGLEANGRTTAIVKNDGGTLELHGSNSFEGDVVLDAGSLGLNSSSSLGATDNTLYAAGSTEIKYNASFTDQHDIQLGGATYFNTNNYIVTLQGDISGIGSLGKDGTGTLTLSGTNTFSNGIIFGAGKVALESSDSAGSGQLTFADGMLVANNDLELSNTVSLLSTGHIDNGGHTVKFNGVISSVGGVSGGALSLGNSGTVELAGTNTFSGNILVNGGELVITSDENLGNTANDVFLSNDATFTANNDINLADGRDIFLNGSNTINVADTFNLVIDQNSTIADGESAGTLVKDGDGTLYLNGKAQQTGGTIINDGIITIRNSDSIAGDLTINEDGTFDNYNMTTTLGALSGSGKLQIGLLSPSIAGSFTTDSSTDSTFDGTIVGKGKFTKSGDSTLTFGGDNSSTFSGEYILKDGTLALSTANLLGGASNTITFNGGTLRTDDDLTIAQKLKLTSTGIIDNNNWSATFSGVISGSNGLQLDGDGSTTLSGVNTFAGDILVDGGFLNVSSDNNLGASTNDIILKDTATLLVTAGFDTGASRSILLDGENTLSIASGATLTLGAGSTISDLDDDTAGSLTKTSTGLLVLSGVASHTGGTVVSAGTLKLNGNDVLSGDVEVQAGATLDLNHTIENTFTALTGEGTITLGGLIDLSTVGAGTLNIDGEEDSTFSGNITGLGTIHKSGTGTLLLSGLVGAPAATVDESTVSGGTLQVDGTFQGAIAVQSGGELRGSGTVDSAIVQDGGILATGSADAVGTLSLLGLTVNDGGTINLRVGEPEVAGGDHNDYIDVDGNLSLNGTINVSNSTDDEFQFGVYRLIGYTGTFEDNGVELGTAPAGIIPGKAELQTSVANQVNLVYDATQFWNGSFNTANNQINGGDGVWNSANMNWTDKDGGSAEAWDGYFAVFAGTAGTVTVEGQQNFLGLQFLTDGYELTGGSLNLADGQNYGIRVDDNVTANIGAELAGSGTLVKLDPGTLRLSGSNNSFTGDIELRGGTLAAANSVALGSGKLVNIGPTADIADANVLELGQQVDLSNDIELQGYLNIRTTEDFADLRGTITATEVEDLLEHSVLLKSGTPTLNVHGTLSTLGMQVDEGVLNFTDAATITETGLTLTAATGAEIDFNNNQVLVDRIYGEGTIRFDDKLTLAGTSSGWNIIEATLAGTGALHKTDGRTLTIDVANLTHTGGTVLTNGMLYLNADDDASYSGIISGGGALGKSGDGTLTLTEDLEFTGIVNVAKGTLNLETGVLDANVLLGDSGESTTGTLKFSNAGDVETDAIIMGNGDVVLAGTGSTTFTGASTYLGDTHLEAGILKLTEDATIGSGTLKAFGGSLEVDRQSASDFANDIELNAALTVTAVNDYNLTLSGDISEINGPHGLTTTGSGTIILEGDNIFSGDVKIQNKALYVATDKSLYQYNDVEIASGSDLVTTDADALIGKLTGEGNVYFLGGSVTSLSADDFEFEGDIQGDGDFIKDGLGAMTLSGQLQHTGTTTVSGGTLVGTAEAFNDKDIVNNATVTFSQDQEDTYGGVISGSGNVVIEGDGLTITGTNSYAGTTTLNGVGVGLEGATAALGADAIIVNSGIATASTIHFGTDDYTLTNDVTLNVGNTLNVLQADEVDRTTLTGEISGAGDLVKDGGGALFLNPEDSSSFIGSITVEEGSLEIEHGGALGGTTNTVVLEDGTSLKFLDDGLATTIQQAIQISGTATLNTESYNVNLSGAIGDGAATDKLTLTGAGLGHKFSNDGAISLAGQLTLNAALTHNALGSLDVGKLQIDATGGLSVKSENTVIGELTGTGDLFLDSEGSKVVVGSEVDSQFDGGVLGVGGRGEQEFVKEGTGTLTLTGQVKDIELVSVDDGTLQLEGTSSDSGFEVNDGGVLRGNGSAGDVTLNSGATLAAGTEEEVGTFTVNSLTMKAGSQVDFRLAETEVAGGDSNDFINVTGDLTLNGLVNIEQSNEGEFTFGTYRLFNYGGTLVDNGIQLGDAPVGTTSSEIQTAIDGQVNIVLSSTQFWNGSVVDADGTIHGGNGVWDSTTTNWTSPNGTTSSRWMETVGVFAGEAGTVTVNGPQTFTGLQFSTDGYLIVSGENGSLQTDDDDSGIRVDADVTATIAATLSGSGELQKLGSGTLVLSGDNSTFNGGVLLSQGILRVEHNNALGSEPLYTENDSVLDLANGISLANIIGVGDILTIRQDDVNGVADLNSSLSGDKSTTLIKEGVGTLNINSRLRSGNIVGNEGVLNFTDTARIHEELESLTVAAGAEVDFNTRVTSVDKVTGTGTVRFDDTFQLGSDDDTELAATLAGDGTFIKDGSGLLDAVDGKILSTGGIEIRDGALALGTQTVTGEISGSGSLQINSATTTVKDAISVTGGVSLKAGHLVTESGVIGTGVTFLDDDELSSVTFAATGDVVHNQLISGKGQVIQQGGGVLTLQLANTYSGGTVFDSGTIAASSSGNLGSGDLTFISGTLQTSTASSFWQMVVLQDQGTIDTNGNDSTLSGVISGAGELVKHGDGTLTLSGTNTYTGGTTINQGTLRGSTTSLVGDIENNATLLFQQNTDGTFAGAISGTGNLIKRFAGTVTLTGTNSYSGGTTIEAGALQGTTTSLQGNILNDASLIFNQSTTGAYDGIISGTGSLTKLGSGAVFLSGANTYTGGTTVTEGELAGTTSSLPGDVEIQSQGSLVFNQTVDGTFAGILSGDGTLGKRGDSTVTLTGNNTFSGNTVVEAGRLVNNGTLMGQTNVGVGSSLGGNGSFGSLQVQGTVAPGNSIGTLNVVDDYVQSSGSTYEVEVNPDGSSDLIDVGGTATIESNATVAVSLYPADASTRFFNEQTFTILTAADGIDGVFDNVTDDLAGWDVALLPVAFLDDQYQLQIQLFRNWAALEAAVITPNQMQVLTSIVEANDTQFTDGFLEIVEELQTLEGAQARAALDSLSGVIHATMPSLAIQQTTLNLSMVSDRARRNGSGMAGLAMSNGTAPQMVAQSSDQSWDSLIRGQNGSLELTSGWVSGYGAGGNVVSDGNAAGMNYNIGGTVFGIDRSFDDGIVGIAGNYGKMYVTGDAGSGSNEVDLFYLTSYGRKQFENVYVLAAMGYGYQGYDAGRNVTVGTSVTPAAASYHGNQFHSYAEIGQTYDVGAAQVTPLAGLQYITMRRGSFTESGAAGLDVGSDGVDSLRTNLGARLDFARSTRSGAIFSPYLQASWMSELLDGGRVMSAQFTGAPGSSGFQVNGNSLGRNYGVFGTGINYMPMDGVQIFLGYDAQVGRWYSLHSGMGGVQFQW